MPAKELYQIELADIQNFDERFFESAFSGDICNNFYNNYTTNEVEKAQITPENSFDATASLTLSAYDLEQCFRYSSDGLAGSTEQSNSIDVSLLSNSDTQLIPDPLSFDSSQMTEFAELLCPVLLPALENPLPAPPACVLNQETKACPQATSSATTKKSPKNLQQPVILLAQDRFKVNEKALLQITVLFDNTMVTCLKCSIDYHGYCGSINSVTRQSAFLINKYRGDFEVNPRNFGGEPNIEGRLSLSSCVHQRVKYDREIDELHGSITNIVYKTSTVFSIDAPYEPQYYRFETNSEGKLVNESKCGLCPYCEDVKFLPFKNSSYLSHLTLEHGIFSNNYLTPDGIHFGRYRVTKRERKGSSSQREFKVREVDAMLCPKCFSVIEVGCWTMKHNKLLSYFRHFKNCHGEDTTKTKNADQLPQIRPRGRRLTVVS
ncbi:uncharacterized protein CANTADRAFT_24665 [Suhomyces tanzawaensis NRRL Y-17324]|uniref:Transcription regulator Rua1 C-terminal domain-containing protein n=1 Tax=Suhomyces tanzawaensis NRRL Y-17324 TaxID=984487 RepID=A0A1E4SR05_9ASCO|nr:uncharacterized protein CANTADRAFT_24665 [Suhomyces tanzawaensis NRRL Y-17324]ODV81934.1 hypothetical protein CANTADRAFT_24665 [Suhomyces tanzawaensis NRRL Y-17324]